MGGCNCTCSGAMYASVPRIDVVPDSAMWATPKSMIFTESSSSTKMLLGLMSRCTRPRSCAACKPRQVWHTISTTRSTVSRPVEVRMTWSSGIPGSSGITKYGFRPPSSSSSPISKISTMLGWLMPASTLHSL